MLVVLTSAARQEPAGCRRYQLRFSWRKTGDRADAIFAADMEQRRSGAAPLCNEVGKVAAGVWEFYLAVTAAGAEWVSAPDDRKSAPVSA